MTGYIINRVLVLLVVRQRRGRGRLTHRGGSAVVLSTRLASFEFLASAALA